jgi:ubiquinone/menaquinone biosynthesis C-methylase UbiE
MNADKVKEYYFSDVVVDYYAKASSSVGLWVSEEKILQKVFVDRQASLLEIGCGCGRISFGLSQLGYANILGIDFSRKMIKSAREIGRMLDLGISFQVADATELPFSDNLFDGAVFGFNGLMQIPGRDKRRAALSEAFRVIRSGSFFVFTSHEREMNKWKKFWKQERDRWRKGKESKDLFEYGDRYEQTKLGKLFIHVPAKNEVVADLKSVGFKLEADVLRSQVALEPESVREFSDECRFWVVRKP